MKTKPEKLVAQGMVDMLLTMGSAIKDLAEDPTEN